MTETYIVEVTEEQYKRLVKHIGVDAADYIIERTLDELYINSYCAGNDFMPDGDLCSHCGSYDCADRVEVEDDEE